MLFFLPIIKILFDKSQNSIEDSIDLARGLCYTLCEVCVMDIEKIYVKLIMTAEYDYANTFIGEENNQYFSRSVKDFCDRQVQKFETKGEDKHGCCLNFSLYLLAKTNGIFMTTKDKPMVEGGKPTIHCAFIYEDNGKLFVADPSVDMKEGSVNAHYKIPLREYCYPMENQVYTLYLNMKRDSQNTFIAEFARGERLKFSSFENLSDEQEKWLLDVILGREVKNESSKDLGDAYKK